MSYPPTEEISDRSRYAAEGIKALMGHAGWTQRDLARFLGCSQATAWAVVNGRRELTDDEIIAAADMLSAPLSFFYRDPAQVPAEENEIEVAAQPLTVVSAAPPEE